LTVIGCVAKEGKKHPYLALQYKVEGTDHVLSDTVSPYATIWFSRYMTNLGVAIPKDSFFLEKFAPKLIGKKIRAFVTIGEWNGQQYNRITETRRRKEVMEHSEIKKYYVGAVHIGNAIGQGTNASCTHMNLTSAIEEAKQKLAENSQVDAVVVVQIIRVVRRFHPPVIVETIE
jgi:hypothetical protein